MPEYPVLPSIFEDPAQKDKITVNIKIFEKLKLNEKSSYEQYELELKKEFNIMQGLYGQDELEETVRNKEIELLKHEAIPVPQL